jgi:hypothetical protein
MLVVDATVESVVDDGFDFIENRHTVGSESGLELA